MFCREWRICAMVSIDIVFLLTAGCRVASALTHCLMLEQQILCAGLFRSSWFILIMWSSISIPLVSFCSVPFLSEKQDSEINTTLGLLSHFHCFLIIPRHHCPKLGTCLEWKGKQNKIFKKRYENDPERKVSSGGWVKRGHLSWMFVNVQRNLSWCSNNDMLFDVYASADFRKVSPFFMDSDRNLSTRLIIPQLQQFIVCVPQGHLHQQPNKSSLPAFVPKRPMRPL